MHACVGARAGSGRRLLLSETCLGRLQGPPSLFLRKLRLQSAEASRLQIEACEGCEGSVGGLGKGDYIPLPSAPQHPPSPSPESGGCCRFRIRSCGPPRESRVVACSRGIRATPWPASPVWVSYSADGANTLRVREASRHSRGGQTHSPASATARRFRGWGGNGGAGGLGGGDVVPCPRSPGEQLPAIRLVIVENGLPRIIWRARSRVADGAPALARRSSPCPVTSHRPPLGGEPEASRPRASGRGTAPRGEASMARATFAAADPRRCGNKEEPRGSGASAGEAGRARGGTTAADPAPRRRHSPAGRTRRRRRDPRRSPSWCPRAP